MKRLRWALAATTALALSASSPAAAEDVVIAPSGGHELTEALKTFIELPAPVNPLWGYGEDPCVRFGPQGKTLVAIAYGDVTCTAELGTVVYTGGMHFCSDVDSPPFLAVGKQAGRECVRNPEVSPETAMLVSVDGGPWVDLFQPQFTAYTPQFTVQVPADNDFGAPAGPATVTGYGWHATLRNLRVGRHQWTVKVEVFGGWHYFHHTLFIVPRS